MEWTQQKKTERKLTIFAVGKFVPRHTGNVSERKTTKWREKNTHTHTLSLDVLNKGIKKEKSPQQTQQILCTDPFIFPSVRTFWGVEIFPTGPPAFAAPLFGRTVDTQHVPQQTHTGRQGRGKYKMFRHKWTSFDWHCWGMLGFTCSSESWLRWKPHLLAVPLLSEGPANWFKVREGTLGTEEGETQL